MPAPSAGRAPAPGELPLPMEGAQRIRTVQQPPGTLTSTRSKARRAAVDLLYEAEQRGLNAGVLLDERVATPAGQAPLRDYTVALVRGVVEHWTAINEVLSAYSKGWPLQRMPAVDRAILRVGAWELAHNDDVPAGVAISEAVALARALSTDESPTFVNGLLSRVAQVEAERGGPATERGEQEAGSADGEREVGSAD